MASLRILPVMAVIVLSSVTLAHADDVETYEQDGLRTRRSEALRVKDSQPAESPSFHPMLGRGYIPYTYPAIDSCPCATNGCFDPSRYYCGGKQYRKQWFRKWVKAHFGRGSMLDDYPCHCINPVYGRPYRLPVSTTNAAPAMKAAPSLNEPPSDR